MSDEAGLIQPCYGSAISYKVFARSFGGPPVLYLLANCYYSTSNWEIFFTSNGGFSWNLMQKEPVRFDNLTTYYQASTTTSQPTLDTPPTVTIIDGFGSHAIEVEPWVD